MKNTTVLTVLGSKSSLKTLGPSIESARNSNTHMSFMIVATISRLSVYPVGIPPYGTMYVPEGWQDMVDNANKELQEKCEEVEEFLRAQNISGDVKVVSCEPSELAEAVAERAKLCDRAQIVPDLRKDSLVFRNVLHGLLFHSPVAVALNAMTQPNPENIFIAWNTSLPAARAVQQALPMLKDAKNVTIATFDPVMVPGHDGENPGSDVAKWLSHHGCDVTVHQYPSGGGDTGDVILARAAEVGADMIVAGAYGHSKLRQNIFGGTSKILIDQTELPVLLAH